MMAGRMVGDADEHSLMVKEAVGESLSLTQAIAVIMMGVSGLLMSGVMPVLMGGLVDLHRLDPAQLGVTAMAEGLVMGLSTAAASAMLPPRGLRLWAVMSSLALALLGGAGAWASGTMVIVLRAVAGLPEGILLWISIGMIARHATPERMSAVLLAAMTAAQFVLALLLTLVVLPRFGVSGGFIALALGSLMAGLAAAKIPASYAPLIKPVGESSAPPLKGWIALAATVIFTASFPAVAVFLQPIAHQAGHDAQVARLALTLSLLAQLIGGGVATVIAGRIHYLPVLLVGSAIYVGCWAVMGVPEPSWMFISAVSVTGFCYLGITPFLVPMLIEADPSRRAAMMGGGAQVLAGALGPLVSSQLVSRNNVDPVLWLAVTLMLSGLAIIAGLYVVARRRRRLRQLVVVPQDVS